ncbi:light-harvesting protein [Thiocapsa imhoffii]|uniref:Light-harvesting protein n=1 Tax=Thiocapsa imhoffii TaxID=382777 RepID=A0A9X1B978_9GAMM|nr:light-harvesting antenna LH1, alpha subunit [Thiocapsa imhoffii]MBK1644766.1 light-harvesting protein [Thiocapsa imhoffii]
MSDVNITKPKNPEDDWKVWLVLNPAKWLMPILFAVLIIALVLHAVVFEMGFGWA